jgi:hypothetical protein
MSCSPSAAAKSIPNGVRGFQCVLDVITADPLWQAWSEEQLSRWLDRGPLLINPIVYAEIAFLAARAHAEYRARGGSRQTVLAGLNDAQGAKKWPWQVAEWSQ